MTNGDPDELDNFEVSKLLVSRRQALRIAGFGFGASFVGLGLSACGDSPSASTTGASAAKTTASCMKLTAEEIEGPYYVDYELLRSDVREKKKGIPLALTLSAVDAITCAPLRNAAIEIWQCDALGVYSGYAASTTDFRQGMPSGMPTSMPPGATPPAGMAGGMGGGAAHQEPINKLTALRGMQPTDANGSVTFSTILPGWYPGRAVHIHTKIHVGGTMTNSGYTGGHQAHTGQFYFTEQAMREVAKLAPYKGNTVKRVLLSEDSIYPGTGANGGLLTLDYAEGNIQAGVKASIAMAVDTVRTHDGSDAPAMSFGPAPTATNS